MNNILYIIYYINLYIVYITRGENNGKLPLKTCPRYSVPEPDWNLVSAQTGPRAEYQ